MSSLKRKSRSIGADTSNDSYVSTLIQRVIEYIDTHADSSATSKIECKLNPQDQACDDTAYLLDVAKKKINAFPFYGVKQCWFRLYTDISLLKAKALLEKLAEDAIEVNSNEAQDTLAEVIATLDYALIVAGGGDDARKDIVQGVFRRLNLAVEDYHRAKSEDLIMRDRAKRRRVEGQDENGSDACRPQVLPTALSPLPRLMFPVESRYQPSLAAFEAWAKADQTPLKLQGILQHWSVSQWHNVDFWLRKTFEGLRLVPVEIGQSYNDDDWRQEIMPLKDFLSDFIINADARTGEIGYLAQHDLFEQIESLRSDYAVPDYCYLDMTSEKVGDEEYPESEALVHQNIWFGGRTVSPLHHDPYYNILCQIHGTKYVRLYSPIWTQKLYPKSRAEPAPHVRSESDTAELDPSMPVSALDESKQKIDAFLDETKPATLPQTIDMSNNSSVDIFAMETSPHDDWDAVWPGISRVPYLECILEEGEALFIPKGWWHYIRGLSASSISVSFWWGPEPAKT